MRPHEPLARLIIAAFVLAAPAWAAAQSTLPAATKADPGSSAAGFAPTAYAEQTPDFENAVRELDATQLQMARIAEQKASPGVQAFANQVKLEFSGGRASLKGMSDEKGIPLVGGAKLAREHQTLVDQLQAANADVDRLFVDYEVLVLKEAMGMLQAYATGGVDPRLRQAAADAVSADTVLLATARSLQRS